MAYTPTTWTTGDTITASAMNKIENGIANAGGGSGSGLPSVTSEDLGKGLSVQEVKGDVLIPEAEYAFNEDNDYTVVLGTTCPEWFTEGATLYADFDGTTYKGVVIDDEGIICSFGTFALMWNGDDAFSIVADNTDTNTITIYGSTAGWAEDPYIGYDVVIFMDDDLSTGVYTVVSGTFTATKEKIQSGQLCRGLFYALSDQSYYSYEFPIYKFLYDDYEDAITLSYYNYASEQTVVLNWNADGSVEWVS